MLCEGDDGMLDEDGPIDEDEALMAVNQDDMATNTTEENIDGINM